jgi:hypothetical protein
MPISQTNEAFAQEVWDMGIRAVPLTLIGEERISGMNKTKFEKVLNA